MLSFANIGCDRGGANRRLFVVLGLVLAGLAAASTGRSRAAELAPRLQVDVTEVDLGVLMRGQSAEGSFALRNVGNAALRLLRVNPG